MSLRARLLAAFAYVLVLVIVALLVPLALNLTRRVDAEVRSEANGQAQLLAAFAAGRLDDREELQRLVADSADDLGGRVIAVGPRGRLIADSAGSGLGSISYASRPEIADALRGQPTQGERHSDLLALEGVAQGAELARDTRAGVDVVDVVRADDRVLAHVA